MPILKISNQNPNYDQNRKSKKLESQYKAKPVIVIIGRQHCGETHSSFIIHGLINYLCSRHMMAHKLREMFEWWIIPVVNPDGIICGNYRTNL